MARIERSEDIEAWQVAQMNQKFTKIVGRSGTFKIRPVRPDEPVPDSTMANIAEGFDSRSDREFVRYLNISTRSASEFQSHLYVARDKCLIDQNAFTTLYDLAKRTKGLIGGFRRYLLNCLEPKDSRRKSKPRPQAGHVGRRRASDLGRRRPSDAKRRQT
jgi:hypothetical protein